MIDTSQLKEGIENFVSEIERKAKEASGSIDLTDLFSDEYMHQRTRFSSFEEFLQSGGYDIQCSDDFEAIPESEFDLHVRTQTSFLDWPDMQKDAYAFYMEQKLKF